MRAIIDVPVVIAATVRRSSVFVASGAALAVLSSACGGAAVPRNATVPAQASVAAADAVGADRYPRARLHLKLARDQIQTAERLLQDEEAEEALLVLERASADAELAESLAREEQVKLDAQSAEQKVEALRKQAESSRDVGGGA